MKNHIFHPRFQNDLTTALAYYEQEAGSKTADHFFKEVEGKVEMIVKTPRHFHFDPSGLRRCNLDKFPFHILYFELEDEIAIQVLKHDLRHPSYGLRRQF